MGFIPKISCRRCGREYSGLYSRCPNCGTRRVKASARVPEPTASNNPGTPAARRAGENARWQTIFAAILLAVVIIAVIALVSSSLNGGISATPSPTLMPVTPPPTVEPTPTPTPVPTPTITGVTITYYDDERTEFTTTVGAGTQLGAVAYPRDAVVTFVWASADESIVTVDQTGLVTAVAAGRTTISVTAGGVTQTCTVIVRG